jgi:hypothetical protein
MESTGRPMRDALCAAAPGTIMRGTFADGYFSGDYGNILGLRVVLSAEFWGAKFSKGGWCDQEKRR